MKRTLIVIDMQKDFIDGALGTPEAQTIVPAVRERISTYRKRGDEIILPRNVHRSVLKMPWYCAERFRSM